MDNESFKNQALTPSKLITFLKVPDTPTVAVLLLVSEVVKMLLLLLMLPSFFPENKMKNLF